jgi:tyrosyl-tRNA synthetase
VLLTDVSGAEIEKLQAEAAAGRAHPMQLKKELAQRIVADFHSADAATEAARNWAKQFQKDETPEDIETVAVSYAEVAVKAAGGQAIRLDKLLARCGLAESASDGLRKVKQHAVRIDGEVKHEPILPIQVPVEFTLRVGRMMRNIAIS